MKAKGRARYERVNGLLKYFHYLRDYMACANIVQPQIQLGEGVHFQVKYYDNYFNYNPHRGRQ